MNPFLAGLVERATVRTPVLERRPRSLFEPVAGAVHRPLAIDGAERTDVDAPTGLLDRPQLPEERNDSANQSLGDPAMGDGPVARLRRLERSTAETLHHSANSENRPSSLAQHAGDEQRRVSSAAPRHGNLESGARLDTAVAALLVQRPTRKGWPETPISARGSTQPYPLEYIDDLEHYPPRGRSALVAADESAAVVPTLTPTGGPLAGTNVPLLRSGPRIPGPSVSSVRSHAGPRAQQPNQAVAPPPAPVHVTIGRIEVRASAPADPPATRRAPAGPRLSLDAYLNGRRGGSR